jgi:hypothetical protein
VRAVLLRVAEVDYHPGYVKGGSPASVDIGLVFLQQEVKFGPTIQARVETKKRKWLLP